MSCWLVEFLGENVLPCLIAYYIFHIQMGFRQYSGKIFHNQGKHTVGQYALPYMSNGSFFKLGMPHTYHNLQYEAVSSKKRAKLFLLDTASY
jgi:hypothetical protein